LAKTQKSLAGFSLLLGLRPAESEVKLNHHTILFPADYDAEFEAIFTQMKPVENPTIYICAPNDPLMVKDAGHESWFVLVNAPRHDESGKSGFDWRDENFKHKYANSIIEQIEARGISIRDRLDVLEIRTPLDLQESVMAPGGSIYGTSSNSASAAFLRTKNRSPIKNLFCVGGSTHPGGGLPLVGISAEIVANAIGRAR
jgi:phytoene dehydrogenase-like protein